jgi:hypothetical protein
MGAAKVGDILAKSTKVGGIGLAYTRTPTTPPFSVADRTTIQAPIETVHDDGLSGHGRSLVRHCETPP